MYCEMACCWRVMRRGERGNIKMPARHTIPLSQQAKQTVGAVLLMPPPPASIHLTLHELQEHVHGHVLRQQGFAAVVGEHLSSAQQSRAQHSITEHDIAQQYRIRQEVKQSRRRQGKARQGKAKQGKISPEEAPPD